MSKRTFTDKQSRRRKFEVENPFHEIFFNEDPADVNK